MDLKPKLSIDTVGTGYDHGPPVILVVDDEASILDMLRDVLDMVGYLVLVAQDGQAGLTQAQEAHPDLIMTDVMMPVMDGHELCRRLRADSRTATIPVIGMSAAYPLQADHTFDATIAKPFDISALLALIQAQLDGTP